MLGRLMQDARRSIGIAARATGEFTSSGIEFKVLKEMIGCCALVFRIYGRSQIVRPCAVSMCLKAGSPLLLAQSAVISNRVVVLWYEFLR